MALKEKYSYLSKNIILFSISGFVPKILSLILVPLYTSYLTTAEYGISDLITVTVTLLIPIFTLGIQDAVMRFALDEKYIKSDVFTIAIKIILFGSIPVLVATGITAWLNLPQLNNTFLIFFFIMYLTNALNNTVSLFCRAVNKVNVIVVSSILNSLITLIANVIFLTVFKWGLVGYLSANTIGAIFALLYCFFAGKLYKYIKPIKQKSVVKEMIAFSFPLIFSVISWWINNASSRYVLTWMSGVAASGIFAVAYKIPNLLTMFQNIFSQAWSISAIKEFDKNDTDHFIGNTYTMMNFALTMVCSVIMICNILIAKMLYSNDFFVAWQYVPPLLMSVLFNAMSLFIGSIFTAVKDTKTLSISTIIGAFINIICNIVFIYFWDIYGAVFATMLGYAVVLIIRHIILRKHIIMKIKWKRDLFVYFLLMIQMVFALFGVRYILVQIFIFAAITMLYKSEIYNIFNLIKKWIRGRKAI